MFLPSTRIRFGRRHRPARSRPQAARRLPSRVEMLENRELLSAVAPGHHHSAPFHAHPSALVQVTEKRAPKPTLSYYNATNTTDANALPDLGMAGNSQRRFTPANTSSPVRRRQWCALHRLHQRGGHELRRQRPRRSSTSIYGPNNLGNGQVQLVGSYRTDNSSVVNGFFFQGTVANGAVTGTYLYAGLSRSDI